MAAKHNLPFVAFRVVADPAERHLPHAALVGMRRDGTVAVGAVLELAAPPAAADPVLVRMARDARTAFSALFRGREMLTGASVSADFRELVLDVPREDEFGRPSARRTGYRAPSDPRSCAA